MAEKIKTSAKPVPKTLHAMEPMNIPIQDKVIEYINTLPNLTFRKYAKAYVQYMQDRGSKEPKRPDTVTLHRAHMMKLEVYKLADDGFIHWIREDNRPELQISGVYEQEVLSKKVRKNDRIRFTTSIQAGVLERIRDLAYFEDERTINDHVECALQEYIIRHEVDQGQIIPDRPTELKRGRKIDHKYYLQKKQADAQDLRPLTKENYETVVKLLGKDLTGNSLREIYNLFAGNGHDLVLDGDLVKGWIKMGSKKLPKDAMAYACRYFVDMLVQKEGAVHLKST